MNFLGGGERHNSADYQSARHANQRSADRDTTSPGPLDLSRPGDVRHFIHKSFIGKFVGGIASKVIGSVPIVGGIGSSIFDRLRGAGASTVPLQTGCPPGFIPTPTGCVPRASPNLPFTGPIAGGAPFTTTQGLPRNGISRPLSPRLPFGRPESRIAGEMGEAVLGQFGAGTEPEVFDTMVRRCPRKSVLGADGVCYNRGDLRNSDRWWPRGRRPLLTGGDMRAISTASSAAKKLQRKQKQLEGLGLLKRPAPRTRRALPAGHRAELRHAGTGHE